MRRLTPTLINFFQTLKGLVYPLECLGCGIALPTAARTAACEPCFARLSDGAGPVDKADSGEFESLATASAWSRAARKLLYRFKINGDPDATALVRRLLKHHRDALGFGGPYDAVVPVPPRPGLLRSRAADKIAREVAALIGVPVIRILAPTRRLKKQSSLGRSGRAANVLGAYKACAEATAKLSSVLIVDDVVTTGATARECSAALKKAGIQRVSAFALARGGAS